MHSVSIPNEYKFLRCKSVGFLLKLWRTSTGVGNCAACKVDCEIQKCPYSAFNVSVFNQETNATVDVPRSVIKNLLALKRHQPNKKEGKAHRRAKAKAGY